MVVAIGVSPPLFKVNYEPGKVQEFSHNIVNGDDKPIHATINVSDTLAPYIELYETEVDVPALGSYPVQYKLTHPPELRPGWNKGKIHIIDTTERGGGMFSIAVGVVAEVRIFSPYPDLYAEGSFAVPSVNEGEDVGYTLKLYNRGELDITGSSVDLAFRYDDGTLVAKASEDNIDMVSMGSYTVSGSLPAKDFKKGLYYADAAYHYGPELELTKKFQVGSYEVEILNHTDELYAASITPMTISVRSMWNGDISSVYCTVKVNGEEYKSLDQKLAPFAEHTFTVYIDDISFQVGETHKATITAHYGNDETSKTADMNVVDKQFVPQETEEPQGWTSTLGALAASQTVYLVIAVLLLIIINIILLRRRK